MIFTEMEKTNNDAWPSVRIRRDTHDTLNGIKVQLGIAMSAFIHSAVKEKIERDGIKIDE